MEDILKSKAKSLFEIHKSKEEVLKSIDIQFSITIQTVYSYVFNTQLKRFIEINY